MKNLIIKVIVLAVLTSNISLRVCEAQIFGSGSSKRFERSSLGKSVNTKTKKVKESKKVERAKKEQSRNEAKLKKDYAKYIKESQKRSIEIQTPDVQERMKQNNKETIANNKERRKAVKTSTKKAGRKYN